MRISDWSSDVFSSDLAKPFAGERLVQFTQQLATLLGAGQPLDRALTILLELPEDEVARRTVTDIRDAVRGGASLSTALERQHGAFSRLYINMVRAGEAGGSLQRSEEHTSELQSLMRISYAVFCLKKTTYHTKTNEQHN